MKNNLHIPIFIIIGILYLSFIPIKTGNRQIEFPEEIGLIQKGDTIVIHRNNGNIKIEYYRKPVIDGTLYIVK